MRYRAILVLAAASCVPEGNSTPSDSGAPQPMANPTPTFRPSMNVMTAVFEDDFNRPPLALRPPPFAGAVASASASASASAPPPLPPAIAAAEELGPNWRATAPGIWHIENGQLCGQGAHNHGIWLMKVLPVNARIEFDAIAHTADGDLKAEVWGDGVTHAIGNEYNNATSYLVIFGGWHNTLHVLARLNEHGHDRKYITVDPKSDDPAEKPVAASQPYHFKIERTDGKTVRWAVNGIDYLKWDDANPLVGMGHDHFGFNDWDAKVCFDNVKVTPLP